MASHLSYPDAWTRAKNRYVEDLTHAEKQFYMQASPEMIVYDASAAEKRHEASSTSRRLMHKLQPLVAAIEQYGQALDVYSNASPLALSPLWGSIRVLLLIAREYGKYFEKLVEMFSRIGDVLPRFQVYEKLFPDHERLLHALSIAYVDIIEFCSDAKAVFRRGQRASMASLKFGFKLLWKPFESQFGQKLDSFRNHRKNVEKEAGLSHMVEAADARALALANHLQLEKVKKEDEYRRVIAMIKSTDVEAKHKKLQSLRYHGTGDWVLLNDTYLEWKHASALSLLCCYGIPGSGKSVLASRIIDDLSSTATSSQATILYYYCDYADQRTLQTDRILGTLLKQLLPLDQAPKEIELQILLTYRDGQLTPGTHEMIDLLCSLMPLCAPAHIVLDGLDECEKQPRQGVLDFLKRLSTLGNASIHICVSCRDEDQLLRTLHSYPRIQLTAAALESDIKSFVQGSVRSRIESGQLTIRNLNLEHQIVQELVTKSHGMFLWIFFQLDDLCEAISDAMIRQTLRDLPVGLVETYERILLKISKGPLHKQEIALRAFRWTLCSRRPMKAGELQEAVAFDSSDKFWDRDKIPDEDLMVETRRGLLVRDQEDRVVRFARHTVQQYLLSAPKTRTSGVSRLLVSSRSEATAYVGQVCVTYLCFTDFETQVARRTPNVQLEPPGVLKPGGVSKITSVLGFREWLLAIPYRLLGGKSDTAPLDINYSKYLAPYTHKPPQTPSSLGEKYQLLDYIVEYWMDHTQELEPALEAKLRHLVMHKTLSFEFRPWGPNQHFGPYGCVSCPDATKAKELPFMSLFHYAARVGHWSLMEGLVAEYCQHERPFDETLLIACRQGQGLIVQNLMRQICDDISDGRAVKVAAAAGHADVLKYLLGFSQRMDGTIMPSYNVVAHASSLLNVAVTSGQEEVVDIILASCHESDPEHYDDSVYINQIDERTGRTVSLTTVMCGNDNMVRRLQVRGAKIKIRGNSALHVAAEYGHQGILRTLLECCARDWDNDDGGRTHDIEDEDGREGTHVQTLLRMFDAKGDTPLHKAARNGHSAVVKLILEYQPTIDLRREGEKMDETDWDFTALHLAARGGHLAVLQVLVENGASIDATTSALGWRALHFAAAEGHAAIIDWLLRNDANPDKEARDGTTALVLAVDRAHEGVVRAILAFKSANRPHYRDGLEVARLIEMAAKDGNTAIVGALSDFTDHFEALPLEGIIEETKRQKLLMAHGLLDGLPRREDRAART